MWARRRLNENESPILGIPSLAKSDRDSRRTRSSTLTTVRGVVPGRPHSLTNPSTARCLFKPQPQIWIWCKPSSTRLPFGAQARLRGWAAGLRKKWAARASKNKKKPARSRADPPV